ncbi:borealin [Austrofundulus limnaeus]|uniref:Borealin n=1 Tax=Austrofundulus limnaeus TaxID=52670 RepID=A0A2I4D9M4_AUSLI|nr:PREDICTED: borealin-like [Austrofundulus limnaeus]
MAPRKRKTKPRKNNAKAAKLEAFLQDFNSEVETRVRQMREDLNQLLNHVDSSYNLALFKMPKAVRQNIWLDLLKPEEPKTLELDDVKQRQEDDVIMTRAGAEDQVLQKTVSKLKNKKKAETTSDDENVPSSSRKGRTSRKPQSTRTTTKRKASRQSNRKPLITPARTMLDSSMMGSTPLITPRFDPSLPKTPAVRVPRHKEQIYSISVNGSPVAAGSEDVVLHVPMGNGQSLQLLASQMDSVDLSQLDQMALRSIQLLQNRLTTLCGTSD